MALTPKQRNFCMNVLEISIDRDIKNYLNKPGYAAESMIANKITILNYLKAQQPLDTSSDLRSAVVAILDNRAEEYLHPDDREMLQRAIKREAE